MTESGVLMAIGVEGSFQVVGIVSTTEEAIEMADGYIAAGPEGLALCPEEFQIHWRTGRGFYTRLERWEA
jgi:hypothetical protein